MSERVADGGFPAGRHDHGDCVAQALDAAEAVCARRGARLTALRRRVLELVWGGHEPVKAYDILDVLRAEQMRAAPPTVYRALDFLMAEGLVHRLESLNAYVGCADPRHQHAGQFLICKHCGAVAEMDDPGISAMLEDRAGRVGFQLQEQTIELAGMCPQCQEPEGDALK